MRFRASDGREIVATLQQHHNVQPGQTLQVIYDARDPSRVETGTIARAKQRRLLFTVLSAVVGLVVCALGRSRSGRAQWRIKRSA